MATRLFSDLQDSAGRRYYFDLDSSPGVCQPGVGSLSIIGRDATYPGTVFRTPTPATLTLNGLAIEPSGSRLTPGAAALAFSNSVIGLLTIRTITLTLASPVESPPASFAPTILFINTITPAPAALTFIGYDHSLSEGGNIGFVRPAPADLTLFGYQYTRIIPPPPGEGLDGVVGTAFMEGLAPTLETELVISPLSASLVVSPLVPHTDPGFIWIDDDPAPAIQWT